MHPGRQQHDDPGGNVVLHGLRQRPMVALPSTGCLEDQTVGAPHYVGVEGGAIHTGVDGDDVDPHLADRSDGSGQGSGP